MDFRADIVHEKIETVIAHALAVAAARAYLDLHPETPPWDVEMREESLIKAIKEFAS